MLRDDRQLALNAAVEACLHAAHVHEDGARAARRRYCWPAPTRAQRRRDAERFWREHSAAPGRPAAGAGSRIRGGGGRHQPHQGARWRMTTRRQALERSNAAEEALAAALREALQQELPPDCSARDRADPELAGAARLTASARRLQSLGARVPSARARCPKRRAPVLAAAEPSRNCTVYTLCA